ncbi:Rap1-interacting factor 1 N terminal-domain-containing protein [Pseudomassariella vexata]|uniref:Rap1-interacting factor 1 N terminal-domain-containing protein n=1 Tax=Pseudomassariella vexata TaxID=1141098 RepID=A0A1Y2DCZ6_9PEZI|nr:Rap1-interacting factor 1 N terminal-domain-containing protein [Pseudomassariella vexata]ORY57141.1 Rap1-interacting factor 1 N terminal-domain-containing protein [Pseudomassariella vexata]
MVPQVVVPTKGLETLPTRPPTPPREKTHEIQALARRSLDPRRSLHTPPNYSPDSSDLSNPASTRTRKKVGFSSQADYRDAATYAEDAKKRPTPLSTHSTTKSSKPIKSILKPTAHVAVNPLDPSASTDDATRHANLANMLESTIKQLAGADRDSKLDAYIMLVRVLKASNNLPDRIALQDKMSLFTQFMQRDVTTKTSQGTIDSSLVNHALTLLITFLHFPAIASTLSSDFGVFVIDHCIRSFEDPAVPKDVVRHLMQVAASQHFPPKVMTADRVGRLVASLHTLEDHLAGKSIVMSRILIYRRLIQQAKLHMISHSEWLNDLFTDMLSGVREIRETAIALGMEVSFTIGKEKQLSRKVMEILQVAVNDTKYIEYYAAQLKVMAKDKQVSVAVPQIWSVMLLLMRYPLEKWEYFGSWLGIIQLCFNSSDFPTRFEANYAWNRLVYALQLNTQSFLRTLNTVCEPFMGQLKRKGNGKQSEELRRVVFGSICNIYYYAFKPNANQSQLDAIWDGCVRPLMHRMVVPEMDGKTRGRSLAETQDNVHQAMLILTGLFDSSTPRLWKEDHVADNPLVKPEELPALDPKWLRRNASKVFEVLDPLLSKTFVDLSDSESVPHKLWRTVVGAVAFAASKEVKVSTDTAVFMASAFTFLFRVWSRGITDANHSGDRSRQFCEATHEFISTMTDALGTLPFTEKQLSMGGNAFQHVATPSHRPGKGQGITRTPLHHLFSILSTLPLGVNDDEGLSDLIRSVFNPFFAAKSPRARIDLAHELMQLISMDSISPYGPWLVISEIVSNPLENSQGSHSSTHSSGELPVGHGYREIVKHLERGIKSTPNLPWEHWHSLFQVLVTRATEQTGEAGCAIGVVEPLAKAVLDVLSNEYEARIGLTLFKCGVDLISTAKQPRDRQALDAGRRRLWGTSVAGSRSMSLDPYDNLYRLMNHLLAVSYRQYGENENKEAVSLLAEVAGFLSRCNRLLVCKTLINLQDSLGLWIQDTDGRYNSIQSSSLSDSVKLLWNRIDAVFTEAGNLEQIQLEAIEPLLCSAFESKHMHIVNGVSTLWNKAFDQVDEVQYPEKLKAVLLSLRPYVDLILPGLDISSYECSGRKPSFIESQSQEEPTAFNKPTRSGNSKTTQPARRSSRRSATPASAQLSLPKKRRLDFTPTDAHRKSARRSSARLRHDDSQIQFAAIESSSPMHNAAEPQVLTDRQKEVRERQRENATLVPDIQSSGKKNLPKQPSPLRSGTSDVPAHKVTTPKTHRSFENYVSSTPTPRRGQAPPIGDNDQEMTDDIPSSPPNMDVRRYPLLPEINKSQSSSSSVLDDWAFMSSPISGSPRQNRQVLSNEQQLAEKETNGIATAENSSKEVLENAVVVPAADVSEDDAERGEIGGESLGDDIAIDGTSQAEDLPLATRGPSTPSAARMIKDQVTPKSVKDVFVDALTSPVCTPPSKHSLLTTAPTAQPPPGTSQLKGGSFELSDLDEGSMLRLVVEIDARTCEPMPRYSESPEKSRERTPSPVSKCNIVHPESKIDGSKTPNDPPVHESSPTVVNTTTENPTSTPSPAIPSTPVNSNSSQASGKASKRRLKKKRKRVLEKSEEAGSNKRRHDRDAEVDVDGVSESQLPPSSDNTCLEQSEISGKELHSNTSQGSLGYDPESKKHGSPVSGSDKHVDERKAVELQLTQETSHNDGKVGLIREASGEQELNAESPPVKEVEATDITMGEVTEEEARTIEFADAAVQTMEEATLTSEKSPMEKIMDALRGGLEELRTVALSRGEVYQVEGMFMDIKRELYGAESRGRGRDS